VNSKLLQSFLACSLVILVAGCATRGGSTGAATSSSSIPSGMNALGEVVDSSQVSEGHGKKVTGINGYSGEILGTPVSGSKFSRLQIGMTVAQVADILGTPSQQGNYVTGQAFNPFNFSGAGSTRYQMIYKNQGRLIFDSPSAYDFGGMTTTGASHGAYGRGYLVWIINSSN
jgi:outer membrane protein assembly factor BamE (lipoprotein component of BamABCDE complex)